MSQLVLDGSMAVAWVFEDEADATALAVREQVARHGALVPTHWRLEVANALIMAERRGRLREEDRVGTLADLAVLPIEIDDGTNTHAWHATVALAARHRLTSYDAAYLELARRRRLPLASKDRDLVSAAALCGVPLAP